MAKPIRATPTLKGDDAVKFVRNMIQRERSAPTDFDKHIVKSLKRNWKIWSSF